MKVLIADNERYCRDFLQALVERNQDMQVSGIAVDADGSAQCVVARELRSILEFSMVARFAKVVFAITRIPCSPPWS